MKAKIDAVIVERNKQGKTIASFFREGKQEPKPYFPITDTSARRIALYIWDHMNDFRMVPIFLTGHTGWLAEREREAN